MNKMRQYFSSNILIGAFLKHLPALCSTHTTKADILCAAAIAVTGSAFLYLAHFGITLPWLNTLLGLLFLYLLLPAGARTWFFTGAFLSLLWFWWIALSFLHYHMAWAIPLVLLFIALVYGTLFWLIAKTAELLINKSVATQRIPKLFTIHYSLFTLSLKALGLLGLSYVHPFTFDWFKPELMFTESDFGIRKWQFAAILAALVLVHWRKSLLFLPLVLLAWQPVPQITGTIDAGITLVTTHTPVEAKWNKTKQPAQFQKLFAAIDDAIDANKSLVVLPESVFPVFLNRNQKLFDALHERSKRINIVTGALYWDGKTPRNAAYIFTKDGRVRVANKVILVPFGEANPLPDFLSDWVNRVFYDNAVDYKADAVISDYTIERKTYRNAICFEATSEPLYRGNPKRMIVLSNNGWFVPSIEPTLQRILLQYYSRKYGTTIYHAVNMAPSYTIVRGNVVTQ